MNKTKFYTIGLIAGSLFATSCDDRVDCGCDCNMPTIEKWDILKAGEAKNDDGTVNAGTAIVLYGKNLTEITAISFGGQNAELHPAFMEDNKIIFQVPSGIPEDCVAHITTASCEKGFDSDLLKVVVAPPCVAMCDNEMAVKTLKVAGNSLFAPLTAKFWDGEDHTIEASTDNGLIVIDDQNHATITIPEGVADVTVEAVESNPDAGKIVFESKAGTSITNFRFRDTRNMLITHDDEEYLNLFNQQKPDVESYDEENDRVIGLPTPKETLKETVFKSDNTRGDFSIFHDLAGYTAWTYAPTGEANPENKAPNTPTPFGCFSQSIVNEQTKFNDYVIKFEVFVSASNPINGNGLAVSFYNSVWQDIRTWCAFWQPSKATFGKDADGVWTQTCTCENWTSGGDWLTITIPLDEIKYDFMSAGYPHCAQDNRLGVDDEMYKGFGDKQEGLAMFDNNTYAKLFDKILGNRAKNIQSIGFEFGNADQPNQEGRPLIAVDNLRIVPSDNNGGVYPLTKWGQPTRDFYIAPVYNCK